MCSRLGFWSGHDQLGEAEYSQVCANAVLLIIVLSGLFDEYMLAL
jgi:hypothetical protein